MTGTRKEIIVEKYREKLKNQTILYLIGVVVLIAVQALAFAGVLRPVTSNEHWAGAWNGFIAGASFGIMVLLVVGIVLNLWAMRSEAALKRLYAKENDERQAEICKRARSSGLTISIFTMLLAVIVSGYFNVTVSLTCLGCLIVTALAGNFSKLYWNNRI